MKKIFLAIAIIGFVTFGALGVQHLVASSHSVEMVKFDKDPKKEGEKKSQDSKQTSDVKAEGTNTTKDDGCASSCSSKSSSDCCAKSKESCSKECPDKK
jgi:hypothetical protein